MKLNTDAVRSTAVWDDEEKARPKETSTSSPSSSTPDGIDRVGTFDHVPLYDPNTGKVNLIPMPTSDPNDPLNMKTSRKIIAIGALCLFGTMAAAAELILGAMLPVFAYVYAGLDYKTLAYTKLPAGVNGLAALKLVDSISGVAIWKVYLLASLPVLIIGLVNIIFVPLAISYGRRPVILIAGLIAMGGCVWSGNSTSLNSHIAARSIQAVGAGTVESLLPFIIQDMVFYHQRNLAISVVFVSQGMIIVGLGIASPYLIINLSWQWVYFITAIAGGVFWCGVFLTLPETRYDRSQDEMKGIPAVPLPEGQDRPILNYEKYPMKSYVSTLNPFPGPTDARAGLVAIWHVLQTFFYPHILFVTLLNSAMVTTALGAGYTVAPQLLTEPYAWPFFHLGLCLVVVIIAAMATLFLSGFGADAFANYMSKRTGTRNPEVQALNLVLPCACSIVGCVLFGLSGDNPFRYPWPVYLLSLGLICYGFLAATSVSTVYVLESYPHLAGPSLVNISSVRCIVAFCLTFRISEWVAALGYLKTFMIYAGVLGAFFCFLPIIYVWGPTWRKKWPGPRQMIKHDTTLHE